MTTGFPLEQQWGIERELKWLVNFLPRIDFQVCMWDFVCGFRGKFAKID